MRRWRMGFGVAMLSLMVGAFALSRTGLAAAPTVNVPAKVSSMAEAVKVGHELYMRETFGGVRTCEACHTNGGRGPGKLPNGAAIPGLEGAAAMFPRFVPAAGRVVTLEQQLVKCIKGAEKGKPPALGSVALSDLAAYVTSLAKGKVMGSQFAGN
jgi:thiosulfate dehydrogenase